MSYGRGHSTRSSKQSVKQSTMKDTRLVSVYFSRNVDIAPVREAARMVGVSVSEFVRGAALSLASKVLERSVMPRAAMQEALDTWVKKEELP